VNPALPIRILNPELELIAEIDAYAELYYSRKLTLPGTFALSMPLIRDSEEAIAVGNYLLAGYSSVRLGMILEVKKYTLPKGTPWIIARGNEAKCLLGRRLVTPPAGFDRFELTGAAETMMKAMVNSHCGQLSGQSREFRHFQIATDRARGKCCTVSCSYSNLLSELEKQAMESRLGFSMNFLSGEKKIEFDVIEGTDRSAGQAINGRALLSTAYDSVKNVSIEQGQSQYSNLLYVKGARLESGRSVAECWKDSEPQGEQRFEKAIDAMNLTAAAELKEYGISRLNDFVELFNLQAELPANPPLEPDRDYFLGDLCSVEAYGHWYTVPLETIEERWNRNGAETILGFGRPALGSHGTTLRETEALWEALGAL
jgi:hypothetical protein